MYAVYIWILIIMGGYEYSFMELGFRSFVCSLRLLTFLQHIVSYLFSLSLVSQLCGPYMSPPMSHLSLAGPVLVCNGYEILRFFMLFAGYWITDVRFHDYPKVTADVFHGLHVLMSEYEFSSIVIHIMFYCSGMFGG